MDICYLSIFIFLKSNHAHVQVVDYKFPQQYFQNLMVFYKLTFNDC